MASRIREDEKTGRTWNDMPIDILVMIYKKLSVEDLVTGAPFCCSCWYMASKEPFILKHGEVDLGFLRYSMFDDIEIRKKIVDFVVARSQGYLTSVKFPWTTDSVDLLLILHRGISAQAYNANTPILDPIKGGVYVEFGRTWTAKDIGLHDTSCTWAPGFMSVNTSLGAERAFLRLLYRMYAEWGVDFVKHDCVFGNDLDSDEISVVSKVLKELNRPMLYSVSPGTSVTPNMAKYVSTVVNMYRIAGDDWDTWRNVEAHFDVSGQFAAANMIGANITQGKSWPDLDMLPLGWLTDPGSSHRSFTRLDKCF